MKKVFCSFIIGVLLISIVGCGNTTGKDSSEQISKINSAKESVNSANETNLSSSAVNDVTEAKMISIDGKTEYTKDYFKNAKLTILVVWESFCKDCKNEFEYIDKFIERLPSDVQLLGVHMDWKDDLSEAETYIDKYNLTFPTVQNTEYVKTNFTGDVKWIPTLIFVDSKGNKLGENVDFTIQTDESTDYTIGLVNDLRKEL